MWGSDVETAAALGHTGIQHVARYTRKTDDERATMVDVLRDRGDDLEHGLLQHLSPLGWEHINLTGDYLWRQTPNVQRGRFRSLKPSYTTAPLKSAA